MKWFAKFKDALRAGLGLLMAVLGAGCLIVIGELDRLIASSISNGQSRPLADSIGPAALSATDSWSVWLSASAEGIPVAKWIIMSVVVDLVFIGCYATLMLKIAGFKGGWRQLFSRQLGDISHLAAISIGSLVLADVIEDLMLIGLAAVTAGGHAVSAFIATSAAIISLAKWALFAFVVLVLVRGRRTRVPIRTYLADSIHALYTHRLAVIVLILLAVLSLLPLGNIFDQLPDVQRQWLDGEDTGLRHGMAAVFAVVLVSTAFFLIGRRRSQMEWRKYVYAKPPDGPGQAFWWLAALLVVLAGAIHLAVTGETLEGPAIMYLVVPAAILLSFGLRHFPPILKRVDSRHDDLKKELTERPQPTKRAHEQRARFTVRAGDVLAVLFCPWAHSDSCAPSRPPSPSGSQGIRPRAHSFRAPSGSLLQAH